MQLIDKEELRNKLCKEIWNAGLIADSDDFYLGQEQGLSIAVSIVDKMPAAEERKHGHWIETKEHFNGAYGNLDFYKCSVCGEHILENSQNGAGNYCPNCGAKMDGE